MSERKLKPCGMYILGSAFYEIIPHMQRVFLRFKITSCLSQVTCGWKH